MVQENVIKLCNIFKIYRQGEDEVRAIDDISMEINSGEFVAVVGASGSGKSTLMNLLGCLDTPTKGEYYLDSTNVSELGDKALSRIRNIKIGFIFQGFNLVPGLNAYENVELPLIYRKMSRNERQIRCNNALEQVGLALRKTHKPSQLSGGQQQRVAIARAIAGDPQLILADEPTGNLDSKSGSEVMSILKNLNKAGKTIVLITHDMNIAAQASRCITISDGKIIK